MAYTVLAILCSATVYPLITVEKDGDEGWPAFRHAIPNWGQYWHRSCGRVYEKEGPESWVRRKKNRLRVVLGAEESSHSSWGCIIIDQSLSCLHEELSISLLYCMSSKAFVRTTRPSFYSLLVVLVLKKYMVTLVK